MLMTSFVFQTIINNVTSAEAYFNKKKLEFQFIFVAVSRNLFVDAVNNIWKLLRIFLMVFKNYNQKLP